MAAREYVVLCPEYGVTRSGVPVRILHSEAEKATDFLPSYQELEAMCEAYSFSETGMAYLIVDVLVKNGYCTYSNPLPLKKTIMHNLENGIAITDIVSIRSKYDDANR